MESVLFQLLPPRFILVFWTFVWASASVTFGAMQDSGQPTMPHIEIEDAAPPPSWALWERYLLEHYGPAVQEFVDRYTNPDGTIIWRDKWPGMDGSDDGYESFHNFPLYYVLGGPEEVHNISRKLWDGVTRQFTGYGQVYKEFDGYYDWMHHGESYIYHYFFGLADPTVRKDRERALRFAGLYLNEDPEAENWDPEHKLIRSPINGSRGPRFVNTAEDWSTHREVLSHYPLPYEDIPNVDNSEAWVDDEKFPFILETMNRRMMRGDVPLNLTATSLMLNAYMYTGDSKYKKWVIEYVEAWMERVRQNDGVIPDNVGLTGKIGENMEGKWWGGYYGWRWPHGFTNQIESTTIGGSNAYLLTGEAKYLDLPRSQLEMILSKGKLHNGKRMVPHRHDDRGWYDYRPIAPQYPINLWYLSSRGDDWEIVETITDVPSWDTFSYRKAKGDDKNEGPWLSFLRGRNPDFPVQMMRANYQESLRRLKMIRTDTSHVDDQNVHHWQQRNPVILEGLVQLMLGAPNHIYHGGLLHSRLRYFDPKRKRPGVPPDVAALVDRMSEDAVEVVLVNVHPSERRELILQAGMFGEHEFTEASYEGKATDVTSKWLHVTLGEGAMGRLKLNMRRFANQPTYAFPWHRDGVPFR